MGRKTQITREMILKAAYELLDESGIGAVAIKTIAARLGCSTQPVSWQFGSMLELKKELSDLKNKMITELNTRKTQSMLNGFTEKELKIFFC